MELATAHDAPFGANQLDRRDRDRALPDRCKHGVKVLPYRIARIYPRLPLAARYCPSHLTGKIDFGLLTHTEARHPVVDHIDSHLESESIEIPVARVHDRRVDVRHAMV